MKDMLGRNIMVGDKLARAGYGEMEIYTVTNTSDFALQLHQEATEDTAEHTSLIGDTSNCVICDWAK